MRGIFLVLIIFSATVFAQKPTFTFSLNDTIQAGDTLTVKITIKKTGISGFAKFELFVPTGFTPCPGDDTDVSVVFWDNTLKYIWIDLPQHEKLSLVLKFVTDKRLYGKKEFYGNFYYISARERKKEKLPLMASFINNPRKTDIPENLLALYYKKPKMPEFAELNNDTTYRVQIGAYKKKIGNDILAEFYSDTSKIKEEQQNGFYKYTVGNFAGMEQAHDFRIKCGVRGAFVVKYAKGIRQ